MVASYLLAIAAAVANAASNILQRQANRQEPPELTMRPGLVIALLRRPVWIAGFGAVLVAFVLTAAALSLGQLTAVEPILALELPLTLVAASRLFHSRLTCREWVATGLMTIGLAGLIAFLAPKAGTGGRASEVSWLLASSVTVGLALACVALTRFRPPGRRAALFGLAAGITFGLTAAFMKAVTTAFHGGAPAVLTTWQTYAMAAAGTAAMFLLQNALHAGQLVAAQPGITLSDPAVAMVWGVVVFEEKVRGGVFLALAVLAAGLMAVGAVMLARSPLLQGPAEGAPSSGEERWDDVRPAPATNPRMREM